MAEDASLIIDTMVPSFCDNSENNLPAFAFDTITAGSALRSL